MLNRVEAFEVIKKFIFDNRNLAKQGSEDWLEQRRSIIGGSEISIITGENPWSKIDKLVADKLGLNSFVGNLATRWGQLFEHISGDIIECLFNPDMEKSVFDTGSVIGCVPHHRFSPDGITAIEINGRIYIILLEFKAPFSAELKGYVPKNYMPQVKAGLCNIDITHKGFFVNNMFRKCSIDQFDDGVLYNTLFHYQDMKRNIRIKQYARGIMGFYQTAHQRELFIKMTNSNRKRSIELTESDYDTFDESDVEQTGVYSKIINNYFIDVGGLLAEDMELFMTLMGKNMMSVCYYKPLLQIDEFKKLFKQDIKIADSELLFKLHKKTYEYYNNTKKFIKKFNRKCKKNNFTTIGIMPWKLINTDMLFVEREEKYLLNIADKIAEVINIVNDIKNSDNIYNKYCEYYPNSALVKYGKFW